MKAYAILVLTLSVTVLAVTVLGAREGQPECMTCHSGTAPKGGYRMELPLLELQAPGVSNGSSSFQLLVLLSHGRDHTVVGPRCIVTATGGDGKSTVIATDLEPGSAGHLAVVRINVTEGPVDVHVKVDMLLHYDHPSPDDPDIAPYSLSSSTRISTVREDDGALTPVPAPERTPWTSLLLTASVPLLIAPLLPRRRVGRE